MGHVESHLVRVCWYSIQVILSGVERACFPTLGEIYPLIHEHSFLSDTPRNLNRTLPSYELKARPLLRLLCYRKDWILECYSQCIMLNRKMQVLHNHYIGKRDGQGRRTLKEQGYRFPSFIVNLFCSFKNFLLPFKQCSTISF